MKQALVLFGHGARDPQWARPLHAIRDRLRMQQPELRVELAFLEYLAPSLEDCVAVLASEGVTDIRIFPVFIAQGGHLVREVPLTLAGLAARFPSLSLKMLPVAGESPEVIDAMAAAAGAGLAQD